jgi:hypothetical protein
MEQNQQSAIDSLLDSTLDDLADMPEFKVFPNGVHKFTISWSQKEINKHPALELKMKYLEKIEMADATEVPPETGTESSILFMLDNEFGQGSLKEVAKAIATGLGTPNMKISEMMKASDGMTLIGAIKIRENKDKTQKYNSIASCQVA